MLSYVFHGALVRDSISTRALKDDAIVIALLGVVRLPSYSWAHTKIKLR
jgi:hypothetical protein